MNYACAGFSRRVPLPQVEHPLIQVTYEFDSVQKSCPISQETAALL